MERGARAERDGGAGWRGRWGTPFLAAAVVLATAFVFGDGGPAWGGAATIREVSRPAAACAALGAFLARLLIGRASVRVDWMIALVAAASSVAALLLLSSRQSERVDALGAGTLADMPDLLFVLGEGALPADLVERETPLEEIVPASASRTIDLASLLTGLDPLQHGHLEPGDELRSPTVLESLRGLGYEVAAFVPEDEESWVGRESVRASGGWEAALGWLSEGAARPRFALVTGVTSEQAYRAFSTLPRRREPRRINGAHVAMERTGRHVFEVSWSVLGNVDHGHVQVHGSSDVLHLFLEDSGVPVPSHVIEAHREDLEARPVGLDRAVQFTPGRAGEVHRLQLVTWAGALSVEITPLGSDPFLDWEIGGELQAHFVYRNQRSWAGGASDREDAEALLEHWYEAVVLPARAERAAQSPSGL